MADCFNRETTAARPQQQQHLQHARGDTDELGAHGCGRDDDGMKDAVARLTAHEAARQGPA